MINVEVNKDQGERVRYNIQEFPVYISQNRLSEYQNYRANCHWHDDIELIYVISGEMDYNINGNIITLTPQKGVFVNARQLHYGFSNAHKECEFICILFHPKLLSVSEYINNTYVQPLINNICFPYEIFQDTPWHLAIIQKLFHLLELKEDANFPLKVLGPIQDLWLILFEHMPAVDSFDVKNNSELTAVKNMLAYIRMNYQDKISLPQIAKAGNVCVSTCGNLFKKYLMQTPMTYLLDYRLKLGAELLLATDLSITEISYATGFHGASYFAEMFKKWMRISPTEYRHRGRQCTLFE